MRYFFLLILFLFLNASYPNIMLAQRNIEYFDLSNIDYKKISLPPLDVLFQNARKNPIYELAEVNEQIENSNLRKIKKSWLSYLSIRGSYQYGMLGNESTYSDVNTPVFYNYSTAAQNSYSIGTVISIPIDHLFDSRERLKRQKLLVKSASLEKELKYEEIKKEIISLYSNVLFQLNALKLRAESLVITNAHYAIVEKDFANGIIDSSVLAEEKQRQRSSFEQYENTKTELTKNLLFLESITQTSILNQ